MAFPDDPPDLHVEMMLLGQWVEMAPYSTIADDFYSDFYSDIYGGRSVRHPNRLPDQDITITHGRADEQSQVSPASVSFQLDNRDGWLTPADPRSPWWPDVDVGAQVRIRVGTDVLFWGETSEIVPSWPYGDLSDGTFTNPGESNVTVTAAGLLRRLAQGRKPLRSPLYRLAIAPSNVTHLGNYWPCEDGPGADRLSTGIPFPLGQHLPTMEMTGFGLAQDAALPGSLPLPKLTQGQSGSWFARVGNGPEGHWVVDNVAHCPTAPNADGQSLFFDTYTDGSHVLWTLRIDWDGTNPFARLRSYDSHGLIVVDSTFDPSGFFDAGFVEMRLEVKDTGSGIAWSLNVGKVGPGHTIGGISGTSSGTAGKPTQIHGEVHNSPGDFSVGHFLIHDGLPVGWLTPADIGWKDDAAIGRFARLCGENHILVHGTYGTPGSGFERTDPEITIPMGVQKPLPLLDLLNECTDTDHAILKEDRNRLGLTFHTRGARYNRPVALTLDASANQIAPDFPAPRDDQRIRNDVEVQRVDGGSFHVFDQPSIDKHGLYDTQVTANPATDFWVRHIAGWLLHEGIYEGRRYPQVSIDLGMNPDLIAVWVSLRVGDRIQIVNLPPQHPSWPVVDLHVEGWSETISATNWVVTINCSPAEPWTVGIWEDEIWGRFDTEEDFDLTAAISDADTSITCATASTLFTTDPADFPIDLLIGGAEVVTATDCTGSSSPQTFTVTRDVNGLGRAWPAGTHVALAHPAVLAL